MSFNCFFFIAFSIVCNTSPACYSFRENIGLANTVFYRITYLQGHNYLLALVRSVEL